MLLKSDRSASNGAGRLEWDADIAMTPAAARLHTAAAVTNPYDECRLTLTVFVSCYNEADYIVETLGTVCAAAKEVGVSFEIIVIDDCSVDNSRELVRDYIDAHPDVNILLRANRSNNGLAQNYIDAAFIGKGRYYRLVCGDNGEPKESIVAVLSAIGEADCIVPYYVSMAGRNWWRRLLSNIYTFAINSITGNRIHYYNGLAVHLRHNVMRWHPNTKGFGFQADILCMLLDLGFTYKEVPISTVEKRHGRSNALRFRNWLSVTHSIAEIVIRRISNAIYRPRSRPHGGDENAPGAQTIGALEQTRHRAAGEFQFEKTAALRDRIDELRKGLNLRPFTPASTSIHPTQGTHVRILVGWVLWFFSATDACCDLLKISFLATTFAVFALYVEGFAFPGGAFQFTDWADAIAHGHSLPATITYAQRDIGYPLMLWLSGYPYSHSLVGIALIQALMAAAMPVLIYLTVRPFSAPAGYYVAVASVVSLVPFTYMKWIYHDQTYAFFVILTVWLLVKYITTRHPRYLYIGTLSSLMTSLTAPMGNLFFPTFVILAFAFVRGSLRRYAISIAIGTAVLVSYVGYRHILFETPLGHTMPSYAGEQIFYDLYINSREFGITLSPALGPAMRKVTTSACRLFSPEPRRSPALSAMLTGEPATFSEKYYYPYSAQQMCLQLYARPNWEYYLLLTTANEQHESRLLSASWEIARGHPLYVLGYTLRNLWTLLYAPGKKHSRYNVRPFSPEGNFFPLGTHSYTQLVYLPPNAAAVKQLQFYDFGALPAPIRKVYDNFRTHWLGIFRQTVAGSFWLMLLGFVAVCSWRLLTVMRVPRSAGRQATVGGIFPTSSAYAFVAALIVLLEIYTIVGMFAEPDLRYYHMVEGLRFIVAGLGAAILLSILNNVLMRFERGKRIIRAASAIIPVPSTHGRMVLTAIVTLYTMTGLISWIVYLLRHAG